MRQLLTPTASALAARRIVRPVFFMDNFAPDLFGKVTAASWASKLGFDKALQMVAVKASRRPRDRATLL